MAIGPAQRRIVDHLKRSGSTTTADLAAALNVTTQAVRPPLAELESHGLVVSRRVDTGIRGRPPLAWVLTDLAIDLFPDRHGDLTVELIAAIRITAGESGIEAVLAERDRHQLTLITAAIPPGADVAERAEVLASQRSSQGYMAEVVADGDDLLLVEHHCPVCAAATACQGLCQNELELFRAAIGDQADVDREQHLLSGDERCVYRIRRR